MTDVIRDLPLDDRPRERLLTQGPESLSTAQLLAVLLGSGVRGKNAIQLARQLLSNDYIGALKRGELGTLKNVPGIGPAKAARVAAAMEFSRRVVENIPEPLPVYDLHSFGRSLIMRFKHARRETLGATFLDVRSRIIQQRDIFTGTVDNSLVSTRDIARHAILDCAHSVVIWHNHPSGESAPSEHDVKFTVKLNAALSDLDVKLLDHIVVGAHGYFSMKEAALY